MDGVFLLGSWEHGVVHLTFPAPSRLDGGGWTWTGMWQERRYRHLPEGPRSFSEGYTSVSVSSESHAHHSGHMGIVLGSDQAD